MSKQFITNRWEVAKAAIMTIAKRRHSPYNRPMRKISDKFSALFSVAVVTAITFLAACGGASPDSNQAQTAANNQSNQANTNSAQEDIMDLMNKVRLPELPEEHVWREENSTDATSGKTRKRITAVLKYTPAGAARLISLVQARQPVAEAEIGTEDWFPEELIAQSQISGNESLKVDSYAANDFYNEPYSQGKLSRVKGTDYFVLELTAP